MQPVKNTSVNKGNRYDILNKIGEGGMGAVFRVVDRLTGSLVALKQVLTSAGALSFGSTASLDSSSTPEFALANEFRILAGLRHPNIVSVLDYGFDEQRQPYFTMDLLTGPDEITTISKNLPFETRVHLLVQLLQALAYLHQRDIIHRDLKPSNVLVTGDGQVKVLDFGLALSADYTQQATNSVSGTLAYIAPEVLIGHPVSVASDLYAFGLIAYEVLGDKYPFKMESITGLIHEIINAQPDFSTFDLPVQQVLMRLLSKDPSERYGNVDEVIEAICEATGYKRPAETLAIRESYLQAATFVGRDREIDQLEKLLKTAEAGSGAVWLIGGESGVGKSRLLNELRVRALVDSVAVIKGQAVAEGSSPYRVWRDVLARLVITSELETLEIQVLKEVVTNIEALLNCEVDDAPELPAKAAEERFIEVVSELFQRQTKATLLILEDLHWAGEESLTLLNRLTHFITELPILIIGSYRSEEMPNLPELIPNAGKIKLERFDQERIANLSASILGQIGREPQIINFLHRQTEGNIFFIIETVRALAENAGELRKIAQMPLPQELVAGGILAVLQQRFNRVPENDRTLLMLAAIIGREIDASLIRHISPQTDVEQWLFTCTNLAVLEAQENSWRFAHDKLREKLLFDLQQQPDTWKKIHRQVAEAIEAVYPEDRGRIAELAHHWTQADVPDKASVYLEKAALQARRGAYKRAIEFIEKAKSFDQRVGNVASIRQALRHSVIGNAYYGLGDYEKAGEHFQYVLKHIGTSPIPESQWQVGMGVVRQLGTQIMHRLWPSKFIGQQDSSQFEESIYSALLNTQVVHWYNGDMLKVLYAAFLTLNTVETYRPSQAVSAAVSYASLAAAMGLEGIHNVSRYYRRLTHEAIRHASTLHKIQALAVLGLYSFQIAEWQETLQSLSDAVNEFENMGDAHNLDETRVLLAHVFIHKGEFTQALNLLNKSYHSTTEREDKLVKFQTFRASIPLLIQTGKIADEAWMELVSLLLDQQTAEEQFAESFKTNVSNQAFYQVLQAAYFFYCEDAVKAWMLVQQAMTLLNGSKVEKHPGYFELYALIPQLCRSLLVNDAIGNKAAIQETYAASVKLLSAYAKVFTFAQPRKLLHEGWLADNNAANVWEKALEQAIKLQMPYEEALIYSASGQQDKAKKIFSALQ